jgi:hypothetical protein
MQKVPLLMFAVAALSGAVYAGPEAFSGKEMKQVAPAPVPCAEFYADNEWNVSVWGTYAFTDNDEVRNVEIFTGPLSPPTNLTQNFTGDRYLETDHAWGGGADIKYFFRRYFGIGIEGFMLDAKRVVPSLEPGVGFSRDVEHRAIGSVLGSFTLRYPIRCSRFSPYVWAAGGAIFGGGERDIFDPFAFELRQTSTRHTDGSTEAVGQFGGGLEVRFTPHIGWMADFSWNVVDGPRNNFGMVRSGINFAF